MKQERWDREKMVRTRELSRPVHVGMDELPKEVERQLNLRGGGSRAMEVERDLAADRFQVEDDWDDFNEKVEATMRETREAFLGPITRGGGGRRLTGSTVQAKEEDEQHANRRAGQDNDTYKIKKLRRLSGRLGTIMEREKAGQGHRHNGNLR